MASIRQNLETIADFKQSVRSAVAVLGLSATPPASLPALKALLDGGAAPLAAKAALGGYFTDGAVPSHIDLYRAGIPESMVELIGCVIQGFFSDLPLDFRWPALAAVDGSYPMEGGTLSFPAATSLSPSARFPVLGTRIELPLVESIPAGPFSASGVSYATIVAPSALSVGAGAFAFLDSSELDIPLVAEIGEGAFRRSGMCSVSLPALAAVPAGAFADCYEMSVSLPSAATVAAGAFSGFCYSQLALPLASEIGEGSFSRCEAVDISLPGVASVPSMAFAECFGTTVSLPSAATVAADAFSGFDWGGSVSLPLLSVAQVEAADWFGAGEDAEFICSDGRTRRPWEE